jgi:NhaP-type Na+/H+ or K+/H+ antiporter
LPFLLLFLTLADVTEPVDSVAFWVRFTALQLILGPLVGIAAGYLGGKLIQTAVKRGWIDGVFEKLGGVAIAFIAYSIADLVGGNGFIAAFVAGLTIGNTARDVCGRVQEFAEAEGQLLTLITFVIFGAVMVAPMIGEFQPIFLVYAILSLTVIRIVPVFISLGGLRLKRNTKLFVGWFGPRGIASVIYALLLFKYDGIVNNEVIFGTAVVTILLSVFAHGITAAPFAERYGGTMERMSAAEDVMEVASVSEMPLRVSGK